MVFLWIFTSDGGYYPNSLISILGEISIEAGYWNLPQVLDCPSMTDLEASEGVYMVFLWPLIGGGSEIVHFSTSKDFP